MNATQGKLNVHATQDEQQLARYGLIVLTVCAMVFYATHVSAADGVEFADAATQFENWVKGNLGKLAAFVALAVGSVVAAVRKDWSWFFGAVVLSVGISIIAGVINKSFTATI